MDIQSDRSELFSYQVNLEKRIRANSYIESFNSKLRDECLNEQEFINLEHAKEEMESFREDYNQNRPHCSLGEMTPAEFAAQGPRGGHLDQANSSLAVRNLNP